ncbi:hypothetical protein LSH36_3g22062 [Paralvinella palmiformis]|uniref:DUF4806 domain-containing protein n=1 Tax=Paralvinella palmiformis TaxID=53620 RepID=A0AAD9KFT4_9ANNE|nr:hypothetical protein LSH36_3g22062 [Paralvinella palmiformis]
MTYLVVKYIDSHEIVVIPSGWLNGNNCALWPPYKTSARINQAVQQNEVPGENWVAYPVKLLYMSEDIDQGQRLAKRRKWSVIYFNGDDEEEVLPKVAVTKTKSVNRLPHPPPISSNESSPSFPADDCTSALPVLQVPTPSNFSDVDIKPLVHCLQSTPLWHQENAPSALGVNQTSSRTLSQDERIIQLLEEIRSEQASQKILLMNILRKMGSMENADAELPEGLELPLKSHQELYNFESRLEDPTVSHLLIIGGISVEDNVRRVLRYIIATPLAMLISLSGKKNKISFEALRLKEVVFKAIRLSQGGSFERPTCSNSQIEKVVREWFRTAADRDGGRQRRANVSAHV